MTNIKFALIAIIVSYISDAAEGRKPYTLKMLEILPLTGNLPRTGIDCRSASEVAVNLVNDRSDLLPDYHIELKSGDEFTDGSREVQSAMNFVREYEGNSGSGNQTSYPAPILISGFFTTGCKAMARVLHHVGMTSVSIACSGPMLTDKTKYPNLYLNRITSYVIAQAQLQFIRSVGKWQKIAIIGYLANANDYTTAEAMLNLANQNGVSVTFYDGVMDFDDPSTMLALKKSDARIIVTWTSQVTTQRQFLCEAYKHGITGSRYVFVMFQSILVDPKTLPDLIMKGCTKEDLVEQYKYTIGFGNPQLPSNRTIKSMMGYDANEFDRLYDSYTNSSRGFDYPSRFQCHDGTMTAIGALDKAERELQKNHNMSLRHFQEFPQLVMKYVNESTANVDYIGLRVGRIKYSPTTGEVATDFTTISSLADRISLKTLGSVVQKDKTSGRLNDDYEMRMATGMPWQTLRASPPRDSSLRTIVSDSVPNSILGVIAVLSFISAVATVFCLAKLIKKPIDLSTNLCSKAFSGAGGLILNLTSVLFAVTPHDQFPNVMWHFRLILLVSGVSAITSASFARFVRIHSTIVPGISGAIRRRRAGTNRSVRSVQNPVSNHNTESSDLPVACGLVIVLIAITVIWLSSDPLQCARYSEATVFDEVEDTMTVSVVNRCLSAYQSTWMIVLLGVNLALLLASAFLALDLKHRNLADTIPEFKQHTLVILNALTILPVAAVLAVLMRTAVGQDEVVAFLSLWLASSSSLTMFYNVFDNKPFQPPRRMTNVARTAIVASHL